MTANIDDNGGTGFQNLVLNVKCGPAPAAGGGAGKWSGVTTFPLLPVSASMLPNGKLMFWSGSGTTSFGAGGVTYSMIYDPATDTKGGLIVTNTGQEIFCEGTTLLADGRLVWVYVGRARQVRHVQRLSGGVWHGRA